MKLIDVLKHLDMDDVITSICYDGDDHSFKISVEYEDELCSDECSIKEFEVCLYYSDEDLNEALLCLKNLDELDCAYVSNNLIELYCKIKERWEVYHIYHEL